MSKKTIPKNSVSKAAKKRASKVTMDMALMEYVRCGDSAWQASKLTAIHHTTIQRAWDRLSESERAVYRERAQMVTNAVEDAIIAQEVAVIGDITMKMQELGSLALDELRSRLTDDLRRMDMKDADLINIATKCLAMVKENTQSQEDKETAKSKSVTNIFNILDQSIQEHLTITSKEYEKH